MKEIEAGVLVEQEGDGREWWSPSGLIFET
jgi:hypothetical protein